jgi:undecaprenyl-phosphate 4-deoxy-4-formamido-L-arabinose transferase
MFSAPPVQKVSVVIPVYNEQESLPELIRRTTAACDTMGKAYEILLVDDGSSDDSALMLTEAARPKAATSLPCCLTVTTASTRRLWRV